MVGKHRRVTSEKSRCLETNPPPINFHEGVSLLIKKSSLKDFQILRVFAQVSHPLPPSQGLQSKNFQGQAFQTLEHSPKGAGQQRLGI